MKKFISMLVLLSWLLGTTQSAAQTVPILPPIPPGDDHITPVLKGTPAPYDGQLFDNDTALRWGNWLRQWRERYRLDLQLQQKQCTADVDAQKAIVLTQQYQYKLVVDAYELRLKEMEAKNTVPWYGTVQAGIAMGVLATVSIGLAGYFTLR